jgi:hypothetical protein
MSALPGKSLKKSFHISEVSNVAPRANLFYREMTAVDLEDCKNKPRLVTEVISKGRVSNFGPTENEA